MKINAIDKSGIMKEYDTILTYHNEEFNKDYIVYTDNIYTDKDELKIYISEYNKNNLTYEVKDITNNSEYNKVKEEVNSILLTMKNESNKL